MKDKVKKIARILKKVFLNTIKSFAITIKTPFVDFAFAPFGNNPAQFTVRVFFAHDLITLAFEISII